MQIEGNVLAFYYLGAVILAKYQSGLITTSFTMRLCPIPMVKTNFQREFAETEGFRRIADATEHEQRKLRLLRERGMLPLTPPASVSPASNNNTLPLFSRIVEAVRTLPLAGRVSISTTNARHVRTSPTDWSSSIDMADIPRPLTWCLAPATTIAVMAAAKICVWTGNVPVGNTPMRT